MPSHFCGLWLALMLKLTSLQIRLLTYANKLPPHSNVQIFPFRLNSIYWKFDFYSHHQALTSLGNHSTIGMFIQYFYLNLKKLNFFFESKIAVRRFLLMLRFEWKLTFVHKRIEISIRLGLISLQFYLSLAWSNGLASSRKLKTWVYLRLRLARPCVHLCWLAMTCDHFGRDQICTQVNASFLPFGHPTQVSSRVQLAAICEYLRVRLTRAL